VAVLWFPYINLQYLTLHGPPIPVKVNDVVFALHAGTVDVVEV